LKPNEGVVVMPERWHAQGSASVIVSPDFWVVEHT
jgi:hypothetical protein